MFHFDEKHPITNREDALEMAHRFTEHEQELMKNALIEIVEARKGGNGFVSTLSPEQTSALFFVNAIPFVAFGCLDNMIMILAGEYIDQQLGALLCLSTMAAAAIGNLVSDVAGVGLAHYVEVLCAKVGVKQPVLTAEQLESSKARWTSNLARALGLSIGCIIGMFPLAFFGDDSDDKASGNKE